MNVEENRLRTFAEWPTNAAVDAARIAKAGFYYTGIALEVQCFLCGSKVTEWNYGDQAMARHRQVAPDCPFVINPSNTCNIPLLPASVSNSSLSSSSLEQQQLSHVAESQATFSAVATALPIRSPDPRRQYRTMQQRLESFIDWPIPDIIPPEKLAKAGFYYLHQADVVECAFCRGIMKKWERGDDPDKEHRINFPRCDFYMHQDEDDDVVELTNVKLMPGTTMDLKELGIQTHVAPRRPKHATYEGRLQTFQGWPQELKQTPEMLSTAGFYYVGTGDQVRCFHCDGGLRNWEATDDAWTEHARWFPKCGFVNLVRGPGFIKECIDNRPPLDPSIFVGMPEEDNNEATDTSNTPSTLASTTRAPTRITETALEEMLHTAPAMAALEVGLHVGRVKRALKRRVEETGHPYENADQLIEDVLHDQFMEDEARGETQSSELSSMELINLLSQIITAQSLNNSNRQTNEPENNNTCSENNEENEREEHNDELEKSEMSDNENKVTPKTNVNTEESASLAEENRRLKEARLCKICMDREVAVVFLPCSHLATCVHCAPSLTYCPMCRQEIRATVRIFLS